MAKLTDDKMDYEAIKAKLDAQRRANKPVHLAPDMYERAQDYLEDLRAEYEGSHERDPSSKEVRILFDELFRAREALNDLFDVRAKRILSHAMSKAGVLDDKDLTPEERELFHKVRDHVEGTRGKVLQRAKRGGDHVLVRMLEDLPPITASDLRIYALKREDMVTLPEETAKLLVERGKAAFIVPAR